VFSGVLFLLPALVLAVSLLARRYPGERALLGLRRPRRPRWARPRSWTSARRRPVLASVRGGLLIGRFLAVRPPPALRSAS